MKKIYLFALFFVTISIKSQNNTYLSYYLPQNIVYNENTPTPESILGFEVGEWHVTHDKLVEYMKVLANVSDRISIEDRGKTFEGRPLLLLTITSPENHKNIDEIKKAHVQLTEASLSDKLDVASMPLIVYQGFSIHGNEPSGSNASLLLAYYLAAAEDETIENLLSNTVILVDSSFNPDGLQRFAYWANTNKSKHINTDPNDREYHEVWPGGRTNHYWFDMNRDWLPVQLPESRARIETFNEWMPNILTDHHEMGTNSTFFFQPGIQSRVHPLTPKENQILTKEIGTYHAKAFNKIGSLYYTEENYDDYYYGKGSTFLDINGGIGILFEQASSRGHAQETINGLLTFPFTIKNQFTAALSTLEAAKNMRVKLLEYQKNFYKNANDMSVKDQVKAIVFGDEKDAAKTYHLAEILKRHEIEFYKLKSDLTINGVNYTQNNSFIVPTHQKKSKLIKAMFEKRTTFTDSLFYDISAWTFPLAFNVDYAEMKSTANMGDLVNDLKLKEGVVTHKSNYAYLMEWNEYYTPKILNIILKKGIRAKVGMKPFELDNQKYDYGTILIPVQNQSLDENELFTFLNDIAVSSNVTITGVFTGMTKGINLGSNEFKSLDKVKVAMLVGNGISPYDAGEIWHLFDQRYQMNLTKLDVDYLHRVDFSDYTTLIIPNANIKLSESSVKKIKTWVQSGGTIIGYKNTVKWLVANKFIDLDIKKVKVDAKNISFEEKRDFFGAQVIGGSIFETELDRSHPINFGFKNKTLPIFRRTKIFIKPDSSSFNNPIKYTDKPLLSGYISKSNLEALKNTVPFQVKKIGRGNVIVFTDNTNFRGFWYGTNKLLMNAVFFSKIM
ncbi:M14 family metallopeptidase [Lutibacter sp. B1]|uniref:M14 family metallopeptidase n=1 Tax=Lutibacter sp. B1 TaxID=2725996 RepID=UPI0014579277|nr:M14 family metallopeptidase [Lutibacter sp. B1]NLP56956.1 zinc carboxypeptidase [Lutibacter sp. B1]